MIENENKAEYSQQLYQNCCELVGKEKAYDELNSAHNHYLNICSIMDLLFAYEIALSDILLWMGYNEIYVYGAGDVGQRFLRALDDRIHVKAVLDKRNDCYADIFNDDLPIIVTTAGYFWEISYELIKKGIDRKRIHAINTILTIALKYYIPQNMNKKYDFIDEIQCSKRKHFLIVGVNFLSRGAQAMLFTAISEIRRRYRQAFIWYLPSYDDMEYTKLFQEKYDFFFLTDGISLKSQLYEVVPEIDAIINIAGYSLSSYWEKDWFMNVLRLSYRYGILHYLMPQSFGPFDFNEEKQEELKLYLPYAGHIYVREKSTYEEMKRIYGLKNISWSCDLVLQNNGIDSSYIYSKKKMAKELLIDTANNVAIIPNKHNYEFGRRGQVLGIYRKIIKTLLDKGKHIYILPHSNDDDPCIDIYRMFKCDKNVHLITEDLDWIDFNELIKSFQYIVASRFHAIVQAYKNSIPCLAIGWSKKYVELLDLFEQDSYIFDIRNDIEPDKVICALEKMDESYETEADTIRKILPSVQRENCFDILDEIK